MTEFASHDRASRDPGSTAHDARPRTATTRVFSTALALQRSAGNRAVSGEIAHDAEKQVLDRAAGSLAKDPTASGELHLMPS